jgi:sugar phosphate isomerase/epimerase
MIANRSNPLADQIEQYLLERRDWVSGREIAERFGINERRLRQMYDQPGLCTGFAISLSQQGFKHVALATTSEWIHAKNAARREAFARLRRVKKWRELRRNTIRLLRAGAFEKDTGQGLLPMETT